jgi:hypothetical protein
MVDDDDDDDDDDDVMMKTKKFYFLNTGVHDTALHIQFRINLQVPNVKLLTNNNYLYFCPTCFGPA